MTKILLVRHGESLANEGDFFAGQLDVELTKRGIKQAELTAKWICENYLVDSVYSSDLIRAYDTAKIISNYFNLQPIKSKDLREINSGDWQGKSFDQLKDEGGEEWNTWLKDIGKVKTPNGETAEDLFNRINSKVCEIARINKDKTVVIVTHATPIRTVCCKVKGLSVDSLKDVAWVSNSSVTEIQVNNENWSLIKESVDGYLKGLSTRFKANV